jgi:hypothetical protein
MRVFVGRGFVGRVFASVVLVLLSTSIPALAVGSSSPYGQGGWFAQFDPIVRQYNQSGEQFRIEGHCQSACTLFLGIRNVCIVRSARLLFHAGHDRQRNISASATNHLMSYYNARLRAYLVANRIMETIAFTTISGSDMISKFGYRECSG